MIYSKSPLAIAILVALSSNVFASTETCPDGVCVGPITSQEQADNIKFNDDKTTLNFKDDGFVLSNSETNDFSLRGKGDVIIKGSGTIIDFSADVGRDAAFRDMKNLTIESDNKDAKSTILLSGKGGKNLRFGITPGDHGEESVIDNLHIVANSGNALSVIPVLGGSELGVSIRAIKTVIETKAEDGIAVDLGGIFGSEEARADFTIGHSDTDETGQEVGLPEDAQRDITFKSPYLALKATNGAGFIVEAHRGKITFDGSVDVSKNGSMELGWGSPDNFDWFPDEWNEQGDEVYPPRYLEQINLIGGTHRSALSISNGALVTMGADNIYIDKGKADSAIEILSQEQDALQKSNVVDIRAQKSLVIKGDINLDLTKGLGNEGNGYISIRSDGTTVVEGNINTVNAGNTDGRVFIDIRGEGSRLTGAVNDKLASTSTLSLREEKPAVGTYLTVSKGAIWQVTGGSNIQSINADGGVVEVDDSEVSIDNLNTGKSGTQFNSTSLKKSQIAVGNNTGNGQVVVNVDLTKTQAPSGDQLSSALSEVISFKNNKNETDTKVVGRNNVNDVTVTIDKNGNTKSDTALSAVVESAKDITSTQILSWRNQISDVNKRLGDLRTYEGNVGAWARVFGGKSEFGDRGLDNKYTTIQLGADTKIQDNFYVGMTASYTDGESTINNGSSEDKSYGFGIYGGWLADNGQFVDVIVKRSHMDTDFDLYYTNGQKTSGDFDTWGTSVSVEYGWRLNCLASNFWVEPHVGVSYGYLEDVEYKTSTGNRTKQDSMDSLIGRVGLAVGGTFDKGSGYIKAGVAHEFEGKSYATVTNGLEVGIAEEDLGGTFGEVAVGATMNFAKNIYGYGEFQTTFGSPVKSPYQWNVGIRYAF